jgi:hypothetical protein
MAHAVGYYLSALRASRKDRIRKVQLGMTDYDWALPGELLEVLRDETRELENANSFTPMREVGKR